MNVRHFNMRSFCEKEDCVIALVSLLGCSGYNRGCYTRSLPRNPEEIRVKKAMSRDTSFIYFLVYTHEYYLYSHIMYMYLRFGGKDDDLGFFARSFGFSSWESTLSVASLVKASLAHLFHQGFVSCAGFNDG